jgi:hypothetical protein
MSFQLNDSLIGCMDAMYLGFELTRVFEFARTAFATLRWRRSAHSSTARSRSVHLNVVCDKSIADNPRSTKRYTTVFGKCFGLATGLPSGQQFKKMHIELNGNIGDVESCLNASESHASDTLAFPNAASTREPTKSAGWISPLKVRFSASSSKIGRKPVKCLSLLCLAPAVYTSENLTFEFGQISRLHDFVKC